MDLRFNLLVNSLASSHLVPIRVRCALMRAAGLDVPRGALIRGGFMVRASRDVHLAPGCFVNSNLMIHGFGSVRIEEGAALGAEVSLLTTTHELGGPELRAGRGVSGPIVIERGAWVGTRATIFPFVTIGHGAVVGAGSIVREDVAPNTVVAGVPARKLTDLPPDGPPAARGAETPSSVD